MSGARSQPAPDSTLATNRRAAHDFHLLRRLEAGLVLNGAEVKSARERRVNLRDGYARIRNGEAFLHGVHFSPYAAARQEEWDPLRTRKLLLHAREIRKLEKETMAAGTTLVPTRLYLKGGRVKVEIAVARGKKAHDKRESERLRADQREMRRSAGAPGRLRPARP